MTHHEERLAELLANLTDALGRGEPVDIDAVCRNHAELANELRELWGTLWALAEAGEPIPLELRARARWTSANLVQRGMKAVDLLFDASGGRAIYLKNPLQRFFRDVHAMRAHATNNPDKASRLFGHTELHPGTPPPEFFL